MNYSKGMVLQLSALRYQSCKFAATSRAHVTVKVSLHALHVIVSTVAAHKLLFFFLHLKFFSFVIFIVVMFCNCYCVNVHFELSCRSYTLPHKKWQGIMLYPLNFECSSVVYLSVCQCFVSML